MTSKERKEVSKFFQTISNNEPIIAMTFEKPLIGAFKDVEALDRALNRRSIKKAYMVLNNASTTAISSLPQNKFGVMAKGKGITSNDIESYRFLLVDIDVIGIKAETSSRNATDEEHTHAKETAKKAKSFLEKIGFPEPIIIDSANGMHLLYRLDLSATKQHEQLVKKALHAIAEKVDDEVCKVDTVVFDRGRKLKLPGSSNELDLPDNRFSYIEEIPEKLVAVTEEQLKSLASMKQSKKKRKGCSPSDEDVSLEEEIVMLAEELGDYFISDTEQPFVNLKVQKNKVKTLNLRSEDFRRHLSLAMKEALGIKMLRPEIWREVVDYLELLATEKDERIKIYNRIGCKGNTIYYDLQNENSQCVAIRTNGWELEDTPSSLFQRASLDKAQVEPVFDENFDFVGTIEELFNFRDKKDTQLFIIWLIAAFIPDIAHPLLAVCGPHGSGKSFGCSVIQDLVSPQSLERSAFPKKVDDLVIRLANRAICFWDNCEKLSVDSANILCQCVTSGSYEKRKLYTDDQLISIPLKSIVVLNSCDNLIDRPDLLSRTIQLNLQQLKGLELKDDTAMKQLYEENKPYILGYIFSCVATVLDTPDNRQDINYVVRMTEFQKLALKIGDVILGLSPQDIEELLLKNKRQIDTDILESNPVALLILHFMEKRETWSGSVAELYDKLEVIAYQQGIERSNKLYPKHAASLSMRLNSLASMLQQVGITFCITPTGKYKEITLRNTKLSQMKRKTPEFDDSTKFDVDEEDD